MCKVLYLIVSTYVVLLLREGTPVNVLSRLGKVCYVVIHVSTHVHTTAYIHTTGLL